MQCIIAQDPVLPTDFRQHNLTEYNSSFWSPTLALDRNNPESVAIWSRWQWQNIDADPSTLFVNYSRMLNSQSAIGIAFFQHNTGTFANTGAVANYAISLDLGGQESIQFGLNLFAFSRALADEPFQPNPDIILPLPEEKNQFLIQLAPGLQFKSNGFALGLAAENLIDYNFSTSEKVSSGSDKVFLGYASYAIPIADVNAPASSYLRPMIYFKSVPGSNDQVGLAALYSTSKFWAQSGYNSFYGISVGAGGRFFKRLSIGLLGEFGTDPELEGRDPSFELIAAYFIGTPDDRKKVVGFEVEEEEPVMVPEEADEQTEEEKTLQEVREEARRDREKTQKQSDEARRQREQQVQDSIAGARRAEALAAEARRKAEEAERQKAAPPQPQVKEPEDETPEEGERIERTTITKEGLVPGYYLIVNVFGNANYYRNFMEKLRNQGLDPGSFVRKRNNYNYVYLQRYDTLSEARQARRSRYNGRYTDDMWIFAVLPD